MKRYKIYLIIISCITAFLIGVCFIPVGISKFIPIIESQVENDLGVKIHVDKLVLRVGPSIKVKTPIMHVMYSDGTKFAQFDNVKFYISWASLFKENTKINNIKARKLTLRLTSEDEGLKSLIDNLSKKDFNNNPDFSLKEYNISYVDKSNGEKYFLEGQTAELSKLRKYKNYRVKTAGEFGINNKKYISYDINCLPQFNLDGEINFSNFNYLMEQLRELDFHSDVITDLKLYKTKDGILQASGYVNVDNISVLDPQKKNPKSFIYLTLWGDKASVLSNIYTSQTNKVYIEGMINNSKKPVLDIRVKTDDINLSDLHNKLKILTCFSYLRDINSVTGNLNANFTLKGDLNKIKSNGFLKISDASIKANGLMIDKIASDIDFSNNVINIVNTIGYVNNSPILLKGKFDKNVDIELLMNKVDLKHLCPLPIGVKGGTLSLVANITGNLNNILHKEKLQIDGLKVENEKLDLSIESFKIDTNKNNTAYVNNILLKTPETALVKVPSLKMFIEGDNIKLPATNIFMQNSMLTLKGEITDYNKDFLFNSAIQGYINSKDITRFSDYSVRYPISLVFNGNKYVQNINSQILIEDSAVLEEPTVINFVSKIDKNTLKIDELSLLNYNGKDFNDIKNLSKSTKKMVINGIIEDFKKPVFKNVRVFIPQQLNVHIQDTIAYLKGDLFLNGSFEKPDVIGQLNFQNLINQTVQLSLSNCIVDFNKNTAVISAPLIKLGDSSFSLTTNLLTDVSNGLVLNNFNLKSKFINTDTFLMYKDTMFVKDIPVLIKNGKIYVEKVLANIYANQLYLSALNTDFELNDNMIAMKNLTAELFNGKLAGSLNFNLKDEHFDSKIMARNISASPIFDIISARNDSISGIMDFDSQLSGNLSSKQSLSGDVKFVVNNGRMSTLGKLEHLLYAQNVIADNMLRTSLSVVTKAITLKDTGLFKYLRGDISLKDGLANIKMLQSQGPLMSLFIKGLYNTSNDYAQLIVLGRLSDEVVSGLGAFGDFSFKKLLVMLTGEDTKTGVLPEDYEKIPQLPMKNTKEFRSLINGVVDKPASVILFNWISYSEKSLKQKEVPMTDVKVPEFVENLPY